MEDTNPTPEASEQPVVNTAGEPEVKIEEPIEESKNSSDKDNEEPEIVINKPEPVYYYQLKTPYT